MLIQNGSRQYFVGDLVAETAAYRLYLCSAKNGGCEYLLQVAVDLTANGALDRAAYFLRMLSREAEDLEQEYAKVKTKPEKMLNYQYSFPDVVDSFVSQDQGGRRINILRFHSVDDVRQMVPLYNIVHRDFRRVDIRTSIWIMGKLLKIIAFVHDSGISMGEAIRSGNILIEPSKHYVVFFNWEDVQKNCDVVSTSLVREDIKNAAECVIETLGGTSEGGVLEDGSRESGPYIERLVSLARRGDRDAGTAHREFYSLVDSLWPRGFYPFTSLPLR